MMQLLRKTNPVTILLAMLTISLVIYISISYDVNSRKSHTMPVVGNKSTELPAGSDLSMKNRPMLPNHDDESRPHGNESNDGDSKIWEKDQNTGVVNFTLNLPIDIEQGVPSIDELYERIAIVSAFSQNHYLEALPFIASVQKHMPDKKIIVYDLGIANSTVPKVKKFCNVELRSFPFQSYPVHVKNLHTYAWKPIIIDKILREFGGIFWADASIRFTDSLKRLIPASIKHHGYMSHWHSFDPKTTTKVKHQYFFTLPAMYERLEVDRKVYYESKNEAAYPAANRQLYINGSVIQRTIVQPMLRCALELRCIAPEGSRYGIHRFDASILAIMVYKNLKGEWGPQNNDNAIFDETVFIERSAKGEKVQTCEK